MDGRSELIVSLEEDFYGKNMHKPKFDKFAKLLKNSTPEYVHVCIFFNSGKLQADTCMKIFILASFMASLSWRQPTIPGRKFGQDLGIYSC